MAQPFRMLAHNGEINTISGNTNWMRNHQTRITSEIFGDDSEQVKPIIEKNVSDSAALDAHLNYMLELEDQFLLLKLF